MSLSITQTPAEINLSQSPIIFTTYETDTNITSTGSFQYVGDLYYWTGTTGDAGDANYTLVKFPNTQNRGIFDVSKILNSLFTAPSEETTSQTFYFKFDAYWQYSTPSGFVTGSHVMSNTYRVIEGYSLWGEPISESIQNKTPHWPIMTDGPVTQSFFNSVNNFNLSCFTGEYSLIYQADKIRVTNSSGTTDITLTGTGNTNGQIESFNLYQPGFDWFVIQAYDGALGLGSSIRFENECEKKYDNIRIKWKNRYGQFDYFNFNLVSRTTFNVNRQQYQPQLGNWDGATFSYNQYDSQIQNYLIDTNQTLTVNTDYVDEAYNDIFKQLMVSDEVYWVYVEGSSESLRPISIKTNSLVIKTNVVDKLIQYSFDFDYGIPYKLVL